MSDIFFLSFSISVTVLDNIQATRTVLNNGCQRHLSSSFETRVKYYFSFCLNYSDCRSEAGFIFSPTKLVLVDP